MLNDILNTNPGGTGNVSEATAVYFVDICYVVSNLSRTAETLARTMENRLRSIENRQAKMMEKMELIVSAIAADPMLSRGVVE